MTEDTQIAQDMSANATNTCHLENPVHVAHVEHGPIAGLEYVYVGRNFIYGTYQPLIRTLLCFPFVLDFQQSILHFPLLL